MENNISSQTGLEELIRVLQQRLDLPETKVRSILASAIRFIELKHPEYLPVVRELGFDVFAAQGENNHE